MTLPGPPFTDIGGSIFAGDIGWAWRNGITTGCSPERNCPDTDGCAADRFCPRSPVSRGQMAAFLHRAFGHLWPE